MSRQSVQAVRCEGVPRSAGPGPGQRPWVENRAPSGWLPRLDLGEAWASREIALVIELYLDVRGERAASVEYPPDPDKVVRLLSVNLVDSSGSPLEAPRRHMPLAIRTRFLVREQLRGLDLKVYLVARRSIRVLQESLSDRNSGAECGDVPGEWETSVVIPPVLAAGDYVVGVAIRSPYQRLLDQEVLILRLWPPPDEPRESVERNRIVQPAVEGRLERPVLARTANS
jgi:hypothetical protein